MRKLFKFKNLAYLLAAGLTLSSCSSEDETEELIGTVDPTSASATIRLTEEGAADDIFYDEATGEAGGTVEGRVVFTTISDKQKRLYITQTTPDGVTEPFEIPELSNKSTKADGSIDLDGEATGALDFTFTLNVPSSLEDGSYVYNFWSTTGKGDYRDSEKRLLIGVGTIEVTIGSGINSNESVRTFNGVTILEAPLGDGISDTFMSLLNGDTYTINQGAEVAALWDFGYYYGNTGKASFASANDYLSDIFDILPVANENIEAGEDTIERSDLNVMYFALTTKTTADFDAITISSQLDDIVQSTSQRVNELEIGDVVEFVDVYGVKGLIKVNDISPGFGSAGSITFDIKAQSYSPVFSN